MLSTPDLLQDVLLDVPRVMLRDLERYVIFAVSVWLVLWVLLRGPLRHRKVRAETPPGAQLATEFLVSVRSVAIFSVVLIVPDTAHALGWRPWAGLEVQMTEWYWVASATALILLGHDAYFYWMHRVIHRPRLFRRWHRRHHRSNNPSPFTAYSFDLREAAAEVGYFAAWPLLLPEPGSATLYAVLIQLLVNTVHHSGYELMPARADGRPLLGWLTTTVHHDLHHRRAAYNFGLYLTFWDRVMGTEDPIYEAEFARVVGQRRAAGPGAAVAA